MIFLLPITALGCLLAQMMHLGLHSRSHGTRSSFVFLVAWLAASLATALADNAAPSYPRFYLAAHALAWSCGIPMLLRAARRVAVRRNEALGVAGALALAAMAGEAVFALWGASPAISAFNIATWFGATAGALLIASAARAAIPTAQPALKLARGIGAYLLVHHGGLLLLAAFGAGQRALACLALLAALVWGLLGWHITPRGDALFNFQILAIAFSPQRTQRTQRGLTAGSVYVSWHASAGAEQQAHPRPVPSALTAISAVKSFSSSQSVPMPTTIGTPTGRRATPQTQEPDSPSAKAVAGTYCNQPHSAASAPLLLAMKGGCRG